MTTDQKAEAERPLDDSDLYGYGTDEETGRLRAAQVHATLTLCEAHRATALIAAIDKWGGESDSWPLAIREALGLNENGEKK